MGTFGVLLGLGGLAVVICLFPVLLMTFQLTFQPLVGSGKLLRPLLLANWHLEAFLFFVVEGLSK